MGYTSSNSSYAHEQPHQQQQDTQRETEIEEVYIGKYTNIYVYIGK